MLRVESSIEHDYVLNRPRLDVRLIIARALEVETPLEMRCRNVVKLTLEFELYRFRIDELRVSSERESQLEEVSFLVADIGHDGWPFTILCEGISILMADKEITIMP